MTSLAWVLVLSQSGCSYRFTNLHVKRPEGIKSIAVEGIFDTSREVFPHEILWEHFQKAFAKNGNLRLAPRDGADALLRAHVRSARIAPTGGISTIDTSDDPDVFTRSDPPDPQDFKAITRAGERREFGLVRLAIDVEVYDLRTHGLLFQKTYRPKERFRAVHAAGSITTVANDYLRYEESAEAKVRKIAQDLSKVVVEDMLVN